MYLDFSMAIQMLLLKNTSSDFHDTESQSDMCFVLVINRHMTMAHLWMHHLLNVQCHRLRKSTKTLSKWHSTVHLLVLGEFPLSSNVPHTGAWQTLHSGWLHPYHIQQIQCLKSGDVRRWMKFCYWFQAHPHSHHCSSFSDKVQSWSNRQHQKLPLVGSRRFMRK